MKSEKIEVPYGQRDKVTVEYSCGCSASGYEVPPPYCPEHFKGNTVFSRPECLFNYCPHPDFCAEECQCKQNEDKPQ